MSSANNSSVIKNIPGVSIRYGGETAEIFFLKPLNYDEWHEVENFITKTLKDGCSQFIFFLQQLSHFNSTDIGMWVTLNAKVKNEGGSLEFVLGRDSALHKYMSFARLDKILTVQVKDSELK
jgi:anti-anti-sigma factor